MAVTAIPGGIDVPVPIYAGGTVPAYTSLGTVTGLGANDYVGWIFQAPKAGDLETVGFRIGAVNTAQDFKVSFRDVNTGTGMPDGTDDQFYVIPLASLSADSWHVTGSITHDGTGGGTKRTVAAGDLFAVVMKFATVSGSLVVTVTSPDEQYNFPYAVSAGSLTGLRANTISVTYDDGSYAEFEGLVYPWTAFLNTVINTGTTPDELGNLFTPSLPMEVSGAYAKLGGAGTFRIVLYDSDGTSVLAQTAVVGNTVLATNGSTPYLQAYPFVGGPVTLSDGLTYRLVVQPQTATSVFPHGFDVSPAAAMGAVPLGTGYYATERTNAGAWTDTATRRYIMGFRVTGIDSGSSSLGGGSFTFLG